jgi:hypothetical protein
VTFTQSGIGAVARSVQSKLTDVVSVKDFGAVCDGTATSGTDNHAAVLAALSAVTSRGTVVFPSNGCTGGYVVSTLGSVSKLLTLDFDGSYIYPKTNGAVWLNIPSILPNGTVILKNGVIQTYSGYVPTDIIEISGQQNVNVDGLVFQNNTASHSIFWNKAGYGAVLSHCQFNSNNAPYTVYYSYQLSNPVTYTLASKIRDSDFSGVATGVCIGIEGGSLSISDTIIESCAGGGIQHIAESGAGGNALNLSSLNITGVHFEANRNFNIKFAPTSGPNYFQDTATITSSLFLVNPNSSIVQLGGNTHLSMIGNWADSGCITGNPNDLHGAVFVADNEVQAADSQGVCDSKMQYTFATYMSGKVTWYGNLHSRLYGSTGLESNSSAFSGVTYANLGTPQNAVIFYCTNCTVSACSTAGRGAWAFYNVGTSKWDCPF